MKTTERCHLSHMTICLYGATKDALNRAYDNSEVKTRRLRLAKKKPRARENKPASDTGPEACCSAALESLARKSSNPLSPE